MTLLSSDSEPARSASQRVQTVLSRASALALDERASVDLRLGSDWSVGSHRLFIGGQDAREPARSAASFSRFSSRPSGRCLSFPTRRPQRAWWRRGRWLAFTPETREAVLSVLVTDDARTLVLLDALEKGAIAPASIGSSRRNRLMNHRNAAIQTRGRALFAAVESGDRMQVYERLRGTVLARTGSATSGQRIFADHCATCHTFAGTGAHVGPDLSWHPQPAGRGHSASRAGSGLRDRARLPAPTMSRLVTDGRSSGGWNQKHPTA